MSSDYTFIHDKLINEYTNDKKLTHGFAVNLFTNNNLLS